MFLKTSSLSSHAQLTTIYTSIQEFLRKARYHRGEDIFGGCGDHPCFGLTYYVSGNNQTITIPCDRA
ncbi:hypothetical protein [Geitlerinema sp. PCC 9228]|uniref:hypothetical protein n=1 Tax=Geitlerinema sp. PCC 9228 TaxID=111611 RepID=UPI001114EC11|nr:hypothetical protein [Geitlerinema sp. PCC 9228]